MVHRQLTRSARLGIWALAALVAAITIAPAAEAANRRLAISNYQWSDSSIELGLGEHVTWYWVGPDTMHSVTGESPNALGIDSDLGIDLPRHRIGDSFRLDFEAPGTYELVCKLHSTVRGTVTVSDAPGDPATEPDPVPVSQVDLKAPRMRRINLEDRSVRGRGGQLSFALAERARLEADYFRVDPSGRRRFAGWARWSAYLGLNEIRFGGRGEHFSARPGRYVAELRATDRAQNTSEPRLVRFEITPAG